MHVARVAKWPFKVVLLVYLGVDENDIIISGPLSEGSKHTVIESTQNAIFSHPNVF